MYFRTENVTKSRVNVYLISTGEFYVQLKKSEVASWIYRVEKALAEEAEFEAIRREHRIAAVKAYLAARAERPSAKQMDLFK